MDVDHALFINIKFKKVYLYDIFPLKIKDTNKDFKVIKKFQDIKYINQKIDLIFINSVIQYMSIEEINNLIYILTPKLKYNGIIFFGDIPQYNRMIELFLLLFNPKSLFNIISYFFKKLDYLNLKYYLHSKTKIKKTIKDNFKKKFSVKFHISSSVIFNFRYGFFLKKL